MDLKLKKADEQILESDSYVTSSLIVGIVLMVIITIVLIVSWL